MHDSSTVRLINDERLNKSCVHNPFPPLVTQLDVLILRQLLLRSPLACGARPSVSAYTTHNVEFENGDEWIAWEKVPGSAEGGPEAVSSNHRSNYRKDQSPHGLRYLENLDRPITRESLLHILMPDSAPSTSIGQEPQQEERGASGWLRWVRSRPWLPPMEEDIHVVVNRLAEVFTSTTADGDEGNANPCTFLRVINSSSEDTPLLSGSTLRRFAQLGAQATFVTVDEVKRVLEGESFGIRPTHPRFADIHSEKVEQVLDCIFYRRSSGEEGSAGARCVWAHSASMTESLRLLQHKALDRNRYGASFAGDQVESRRAVSTFFLFLILLVFVFVAVNNLSVWRIFDLSSGMSPTFYWTNYCEEGGPTSVCFFGTRTAADIATREDVLRFIRRELVTDLWSGVSDNQSAAFAADGTAWYVGPLMIRVAPILHEDVVDQGLPFVSCADLNMTVPFWISATDQFYDCGSLQTLIVPFTLTKSEALSVVQQFQVNAPTLDVTVLVTYSAMNLATGGVVSFETAFTMMQSGSVIPRFRHYASNERLYTSVLMCAICYWVFFAVETGFVVINRLRGVPVKVRPFLVLVKFVAFYLISLSWSFVSDPVTIQYWAQTTFQPMNLDLVAYKNTVAQYLFGGWLLVILSTWVTYLEHISRLRLVIQLVSAAAAPLLAVSVVLVCCFLGFVFSAMFVFGDAQVEFATFIYAFRVTAPFLFDSGDPSVFSQESPVVGNLFYAFFAVCTTYIGLNIFNGVMMAPFGSLVSGSGLYYKRIKYVLRQKEIIAHRCSKTVMRAANRTRVTAWTAPLWLKKKLITVRMAVLPLLRFFLLDAIPLPDVSWSVLYRFLAPESNYRDVVNAARQLYAMHDANHAVTNHSARTWRRRSSMCAALRSLRHFGMSDISIALMEVVVAHETRYDILRDATLLKIAAHYEEYCQKNGTEFASVDGWALDVDITSDTATMEFDECDRNWTNHATDGDVNLESAEERRSSASARAADDGASCSWHIVNEDGDLLRIDEDTNTVQQTAPLSSHAMRLESSPNGASGNPKGAVDEPTTSHFTFVAYSHLVGAFDDSPLMSLFWKFLHFGMVLSCYLFLIITCASWSQPAAYFTADLHAGLRDAPLQASCSDASCATAYTRPTTFLDGVQLSDLQNYLERLVAPNIFDVMQGDGLPYLPNESLPIDGVDTSPVLWSNAIRFASLKIRMLLGVGGDPCVLPIETASPTQESLRNNEERLRLQLFYNQTCYSASRFDTETMAKPSDSPLSDDAYVYSYSCPDGLQEPVKGFEYWYPCEGYVAEITTREQLAYAASTWLNQVNVRLVALSFTFYHNNSLNSYRTQEGMSRGPALLKTHYDMYVELGLGGEQAEFWVVVTLAPNSVDDRITGTLLVLMILLESVVVGSFTHYVILYRGNIGKSITVISYQMPFFTTILTGVALLMYYATLPNVKWSCVITNSISVFLFTVKCIDVIVIPLSGVISRRATTFPRMATLIRIRAVVVAPFLVIFWIAFTLSGYVTWGNDVEEYATIVQSLTTVSKGFFGEWDFASIAQVFPGLALLMSICFFFIVVVVLLATILALVVQSAEDANNELEVTNEVVALAEHSGAWVLFGPFAKFLLALWVVSQCSSETLDDTAVVAVFQRALQRLGYWLMGNRGAASAMQLSRCDAHQPDGDASTRLLPVPPNRDSAPLSVHLRHNMLRIKFIENWRLPSVVECLHSFLGPYRSVEILTKLKFERMNPTMQFTTVALVIAEAALLKRKDKVRFDYDALRERRRMAVEVQRRLQAGAEGRDEMTTS